MPKGRVRFRLHGVAKGTPITPIADVLFEVGAMGVMLQRSSGTSHEEKVQYHRRWVPHDTCPPPEWQSEWNGGDSINADGTMSVHDVSEDFVYHESIIRIPAVSDIAKLDFWISKDNTSVTTEVWFKDGSQRVVNQSPLEVTDDYYQATKSDLTPEFHEIQKQANLRDLIKQSVINLAFNSRIEAIKMPAFSSSRSYRGDNGANPNFRNDLGGPAPDPLNPPSRNPDHIPDDRTGTTVITTGTGSNTASSLGNSATVKPDPYDDLSYGSLPTNTNRTGYYAAGATGLGATALGLSLGLGNNSGNSGDNSGNSNSNNTTIVSGQGDPPVPFDPSSIYIQNPDGTPFSHENVQVKLDQAIAEEAYRLGKADGKKEEAAAQAKVRETGTVGSNSYGANNINKKDDVNGGVPAPDPNVTTKGPGNPFTNGTINVDASQGQFATAAGFCRRWSDAEKAILRPYWQSLKKREAAILAKYTCSKGTSFKKACKPCGR